MCPPRDRSDGASTKKDDDASSPSAPPPGRPPAWKVWAVACRPHTLTASIAPVVVSHFLARAVLPSSSSSSSIDVLRRLSVPFGLFAALIQLGTNLHNDYADFVKGADDHRRVGQARATQRGWLTPGQTAAASTICLVLALAVGFDLAGCASGGAASPRSTGVDPTMVFVVLTSAFNAVAYTGGPYPLGYVGLGNVSIGYSGLGDLFVFLYFGIVATVTVPYLAVRNSGDDSSTFRLFLGGGEGGKLRPALLCSLPIGFLAVSIIVVNNLRDRKTDVEAGKKTLAVRFGETFARVQYGTLMVATYAFTVWSYFDPSVLIDASGGVPDERRRMLLLPLLSMPLALSQIRAVTFAGKDGGDLNEHVGGTARVQLVYCLLLALAVQQISSS